MPGNADPSPQQISYLNFIWKGTLLLLLLTELLANLVVSKKIKEFLFVHSKLLGILIFSQQSAV